MISIFLIINILKRAVVNNLYNAYAKRNLNFSTIFALFVKNRFIFIFNFIILCSTEYVHNIYDEKLYYYFIKSLCNKITVTFLQSFFFFFLDSREMWSWFG